jgi:hypothetical protein
MIKNAIIFIVVSLFSLIILDLYLLISEIQTPHFSMIDQEKGKINIPNRKILFVSEGFYMGSTNKLGYWGPAYPQIKDKDIIRIALLGNSFVEGIQVFEKYHFRSILENELNQRLKCRVEVLNFGKGRSNLSDMFYSYNFFVKQFDPDIVLFFVDYESSSIGSRGVSDMAPFYYLENDKFKIDYSFQNQKNFKIIQLSSFLLKNSSITRLIYNCYRTYATGNTFFILFDKFSTLGKDYTSSRELTVNSLEFNNITRRLIEEILKNKENIIVFNPRDNTSLPDEFSKIIPESQLIDLSQPIDSLRSLNINPNYWIVTKSEAHWNHIGHQAVGCYLSKKIIPKTLPFCK